MANIVLNGFRAALFKEAQLITAYKRRGLPRTGKAKPNAK
jgi:hypothetical protein